MGTNSSSSSSSGAAVSEIAVHRHNMIRENSQRFRAVYSVGSSGLPGGGVGSSPPTGSSSDSAILGEGAFGTVIKCRHRLTGIERAAKKIPKTALEDQKLFEKEVQSLVRLDHPHVVKLVEYFEEPTMYVLIFELCTGPDLFDRIVNQIYKQQEKMLTEGTASASSPHSPPPFCEEEGGRLLRHMLKAVLCCHSAGIIHRDCKPENFILSRPELKSSLKLIDLGLSEHYDDSNSSSNSNSSKAELMASTGMPVGTVAYMSPEMLQGLEYSRQCDVWSIGVILWSMLIGEPLFTHECDYLCRQQILDAEYLEKELQTKLLTDKHIYLSTEAKDLLYKMLKRDPQERITASDALRHGFVLKSYSPADYEVDDGGGSAASQQHFDTEIVKKMERFVTEPAVKRIGLYIFAHLCGTDTAELRLHRVSFRQLDILGGGQITNQDLIRGLKQRGVAVPDNFEERVLVQLDTDRSGKVDFLEFLASTIIISNKVLQHEKILRGVFQLMDVYKVGFISAQTLGDICPENTELQRRAMMKEVSPVSGILEWQDFRKLMLGEE